MPEPHTIFTLGHSTLPIEVFLRVLRENGVTAIADIRTLPKSRHNPQFATDALEQSLREAEIRFRWIKALGGLRHTRKEFAGDPPLNGGWNNVSFRGYADYMQTADFSAGMEELLRFAEPSDTAILCAEAVPWRCHRSLVADALLVRGIAVEEILYDKHGTSKRRPHRMTPFARVEGTRLWYPPPIEKAAPSIL